MTYDLIILVFIQGHNRMNLHSCKIEEFYSTYSAKLRSLYKPTMYTFTLQNSTVDNYFSVSYVRVLIT